MEQLFCILDLATGLAVPQKGKIDKTFRSLVRVDLPDGAVVFNPPVGYVYPPQYPSENNKPIRYRIYEATIVDQGSGPVMSVSDPMFNGIAGTMTVTRTFSALPKPTVISYEAFQDRFLATELDALTKYIDAVDLVTGEPKRPRLKQILGRVWARNQVHLTGSDPAEVAKTSAFLDKLVAPDPPTPQIITPARKAVIMTP